MALKISKGKIGNALTSTADNHVVAVAKDLYDEVLEMYQSEINALVKELSERAAREDSHIYLTEDEKDVLFASGSVETTEYSIINLNDTDCYFVFETQGESGGTTIIVPSAVVDEELGEVIIGSTDEPEDGTLDLTKYAVVNENGELEFIAAQSDIIIAEVDDSDSSLVADITEPDYNEEEQTLSMLSSNISVEEENNTLIIN